MGDWSDADISRVKAMWRKGATATEIAAALGNGLTRGAVLGKIHRLGLKRTGATEAKPRRGVGAGARKPVPDGRAKARSVAAPNRQAASRKSISEGPMPIWALGQCQCRWPMGNLLDPPGLFCAAVTADGSSWCPVHEQMVYTGLLRPRAEGMPKGKVLAPARAGRTRF